MSKTAIGYVRAVTTNQNDAALSIESQKTAILDYAKKHDFEIKDIVREIDMVDDTDALIIYDFSRLTRNPVEAVRILDTLKSRGVKLISVTQATEEWDTPEYKLKVRLDEAFSDMTTNLMEKGDFLDYLPHMNIPELKLLLENWEEYQAKYPTDTVTEDYVLKFRDVFMAGEN